MSVAFAVLGRFIVPLSTLEFRRRKGNCRMKIAEALAPRADLQRRLEQLKQRLVKNARIQEGDKPEEDPVELQAELERSAQELIVIIQRINRTNAAERLGDRTLEDALAERDVLKI